MNVAVTAFALPLVVGASWRPRSRPIPSRIGAALACPMWTHDATGAPPSRVDRALVSGLRRRLASRWGELRVALGYLIADIMPFIQRVRPSKGTRASLSFRSRDALAAHDAYTP